MEREKNLVSQIEKLSEEINGLKQISKLPDGWLFPRREDWELEPLEFTNITLTAGQSRPIIQKDERGWLIAGYATSNSPYVRCLVKVFSRLSTTSFSYTPAELYALGVVSPTVQGFWLARYDTVNSVYVVVMTLNPWIPYHNRVEATLINEGTTPALVPRMMLTRMLIEKLNEKEE